MPRKKKAETPPTVEYKKMAVASLLYDQLNPRQRNERNLSAIRNSIQEHGQVEPILVQQSTMKVIHGNGRLQVLSEAGYEEVDCAVLDVDDQKARKLSIVLNRSGELAGWNADVLGAHLEALASVDTGFDPTSVGFTGTELEDLLADVTATIEELTMGEAPEPHEVEVATGIADGEYERVPGMKPEDIKPTNIRVVQLFLTSDNIDQFNLACRTIGAKLELTTVTDVVAHTVMAVANDMMEGD